MLRGFSLLLTSLFLGSTVAPCEHFRHEETRTVLPPGVVIPKVEVISDGKQSYALYLPSKYSSEKRWPIVYVFDPLARGQLALEQFRQAAELYGYIVAASNNSRNGPWPPELEAANAVFRDTQERLSVDTARIYFAGFSGGARVSSQLAQICKCAAGVILSGAGFSFASQPTAEAKFVVFSAVGNTDFNYSEVIPLQEKLEKATLAHWLRVFEGSHEWAPPSVLDEALAWFSVQSMKSQRGPRDDVFLGEQFAAVQQQALAIEKSADLLAAWRAYRQLAATFEALRDVSTIRAKAEELEKRKDFRDAAKHERNDFAEQARLSDEILSATSVKKSDDSSPTAASDQAAMLTKELRSRAEHEKKPERAVVLKRALGGVFIGSIESGSNALDKKDYGLAARLFACAAEANPESEWAFRNLAVARALFGDHKGALEALRSARKLTKDLLDFSNWLDREPAFERFKKIADFDSLTRSS